DPLVLAEHGIDPGRGGAAIGQFLDDLREQAEAALQPTKAAWLQDLEDPGVVVFGDRLWRHASFGGSDRGALGEARDQGAGAAEQLPLRVGQVAVVGEKAREIASGHLVLPPLTASDRRGGARAASGNSSLARGR